MKRVICVMAGLAAVVCAGPLQASVQLHPSSYDMPNGLWYVDSSYHDADPGSGNPNQNNVPLFGGLGELTDGVVAPTRWRQGYLPYVGWYYSNPTIVFQFDNLVRPDLITLSVDDSNGDGGVRAPAGIGVSLVGGPETYFPVVDPPGSAPFNIALDLTGLPSPLIGQAFAITLYRRLVPATSWVFLSEVRFDGRNAGTHAPEPSSLLAWAGLAGLGLVVRRRRIAKSKRSQ